MRNTKYMLASPKVCPKEGYGCSQDYLYMSKLDYMIGQEKQAMDVYQCQHFCKQEPTCNYYTMNKWSGVCRLFRNRIKMDYTWESMMGPRDCPSNFHSILCI